MNDSKILFPEGTDSVVHKPLPHVSLTSHWHGPKRFVNPQPRIILVIYNVRCSVEKKLATLMQGTLVYTKHVRLFLFLFCRWRVVGCFLLNFWHIALFLSFFLSTIRSRLRLLVRMDSPDASAVRRVASETDSHRWVPAEPHPGAWTKRASRDGGRQEVGWVVRVMGRVIGRVVDRQERDIHIYTRTDTDTHILLAKPDADGRAPLGRVPLQRLYRIMPPHLERTSVRWRSWAFLATCAPATTDELAENYVNFFLTVYNSAWLYIDKIVVLDLNTYWFKFKFQVHLIF